MKVAKNKAVYVTYSILSEEGEILERSDLPIGYVHGVGSQLIEQVEKRLDGCEVGDTVEVTLSPEQGFGHHDPDLTFTDDIDNVPPEVRYVGAQVEMQNDRGETRSFIVSRIENDRLTVDGNHPFAGKTLRFVVEVNDVRDATPEEIAAGVPDQPAGVCTTH
jgi:FKBP-type peptidyl-prolyl cis-trans isomerase SlyD